MTDKDKANEIPVKEKSSVAPETAKEEVKKVSEVVPPVEKVDPKYAGKSLEEVIEMHRNAEVLASKKASELAELRKAKPEPTVEEIAKLFSPQVTQEDDPKDIAMAARNEADLALRLKVDIMSARTRSDMADWAECEVEVLELAKAKPGILVNNVDWVKDCYKMVQADKMPAKLQEAEERGKKTMEDKEIPKIKASIISEPAPAKAPPDAPEGTKEAKLDLFRKRKISLDELLLGTLTDAEKGKK